MALILGECNTHGWKKNWAITIILGDSPSELSSGHDLERFPVE